MARRYFRIELALEKSTFLSFCAKWLLCVLGRRNVALSPVIIVARPVPARPSAPIAATAAHTAKTFLRILFPPRGLDDLQRAHCGARSHVVGRSFPVQELSSPQAHALLPGGRRSFSAPHLTKNRSTWQVFARRIVCSLRRQKES